MAEPGPQTSLIVGISFSGKTTLCVKLCQRRASKVYVIDGSPSPYKAVGLKAHRINWSDMHSFDKTDVTVVADDVSKLTSTELRSAKRLLNVLSRHNRLLCLICIHGVVKHDAYSLLPYFNTIYFTKANGNRRSINAGNISGGDPLPLVVFFLFSTLTYLIFSVWTFMGLQRDPEMLAKFSKSQGRYLKFCVKTLDKCILDGELREIQQVGPSSSNVVLERKKAKLQTLLKGLPDVVEGCTSLFTFVCDNINHEIINQNDMSVKWRDGSGRLVGASIIDYLVACVDPSLLPRDDSEERLEMLKQLHEYFRQRMHFPSVLVKNSSFLI